MATQSWHELERKLSNRGGGHWSRGEPESLKQNVMLRKEEVAAHQDSEPLPDHSQARKKAGPIDSSPRG